MKLGIEFQDKDVSNIFNTAMIVLTSLINVLLEVIIKKVTEL
jgi:hypothetical protein